MVADLLFTAAVPADAAVVAVVVGIATAVGDALVPFPVLARTTAHGMPVLADLVLAAAHVAAAAVVAVAVDAGLAPVVDVAVAVRPSRMAGGDVAGGLAAGRAGVIGRAAVPAPTAVAIVVVGVDARAVARRLALEAGADADAAATGLVAAAGLSTGAAVAPVAVDPGADVAASGVAVIADAVAGDPAVLRRRAGIGIRAGGRGSGRPRGQRARTTADGKERQCGIRANQRAKRDLNASRLHAAPRLATRRVPYLDFLALPLSGKGAAGQLQRLSGSAAEGAG